MDHALCYLLVKPKLPDNFEEVTWAKLQAAVRAIHTSKPVNDSLEELYKACENLCLHKMADRLYQRLQKECESHIIEELAKLRRYDSWLTYHYIDRMHSIIMFILIIYITYSIAMRVTKRLF